MKVPRSPVGRRIVPDASPSSAVTPPRQVDRNDRFNIPFGAKRPPALAQDRALPRAKKTTELRAVRPNAGIKDEYRAKLEQRIDQMAKSYAHWIRACYRANRPRMAMDSVLRLYVARIAHPDEVERFSVDLEDGTTWLAMDASPAAELQRELRGLGAKWQQQFDDGAPELAAWFAKKASKRSEAVLKGILKKAGYTVQFKMTQKMRDVFTATVEENVSLIKSIPSQFHTQVEGLVMRSVATGRDLHQLTRDLQKRFGVTRKRAEFISLDQNNKATSAFMRVRHVELGLEEGIWLHSHAGKEPRPTHLANHGKKFSILEGWFDPDPRVRQRIMPGQLVRCRCTWKPIVKGFS